MHPAPALPRPRRVRYRPMPGVHRTERHLGAGMDDASWEEARPGFSDLLRERVGIATAVRLGRMGTAADLVRQTFSLLHSASHWLDDEAISAWLRADGGVQLSAAQVRAALDGAETHWPGLWEDVGFTGRTLAQCYGGISLEELLWAPGAFAALPGWQPGRACRDLADSLRYLLARSWFSLTRHTRTCARPHLGAAIAAHPGAR